MIAEPSSKKPVVRPALIACLLLFITTLSLYSPVRNYGFISYDDFEYVVDNYHVNTGLTAENIKWAFVSTAFSNWHPVTWLSHMLDCQMYGLDPGKQHLINVIFHIVNTLLLLLFFYKATGLIWPSALVAFFFAVHPMHVESVAWIAERKDVLSAFFMMMVLLCYLAYTNHETRRWYILALIFFSLGLMSKPMLVTLPFVLLILDYWPIGRLSFHGRAGRGRGSTSFWGLVAEKTPFFILSAVSSVITYAVQQKGGAVLSSPSYVMTWRFYHAAVCYVEYIKKMFYPTDLAIPYPLAYTVSSASFCFSLLVILLVSAVAIYAAVHGKPYFLAGWLWYLGTLVPVIGLVQVGTQSMADRYTYVPYIGLFIIVTWGLFDFFRGWRYGPAVVQAGLAAIVLILALVTRVQLGYWANSLALFSHTLKVTEENYVTHNNLGQALLEKGLVMEAYEHFAAAIRINPSFAVAHLNMGIIHASHNEVEKAIQSYLQALASKPDYPEAYGNLGNVYFRSGKTAEALACYQKAIRLNPYYAPALNGMGAVFLRRGEPEKAIACFKESLRIAPSQAATRQNLESALSLSRQKSGSGSGGTDNISKP